MFTGENDPHICRSNLSDKITVFDGLSAFERLKLDPVYSDKGLSEQIIVAYKALSVAVQATTELPRQISIHTIQGRGMYVGMVVENSDTSLEVVLDTRSLKQDKVTMFKQQPVSFKMSGLALRSLLPEHEYFHKTPHFVHSDDITPNIGGISMLGVLEDACVLVDQGRARYVVKSA